MNNIQYGRKRSGIKRELKKKIESWLDSIEDNEVRKLASKNVIVTGGSIASMLLGEKVNDFDLYFRNIETTEAVANYYVKQYKEKHKDGPYDMFVQREDIKNIKGETETRVVIFIRSAGVVSDDSEEEDEVESPFQYLETRSSEEIVDEAESLMLEHAEESAKSDYSPVFLSQNAITLTGKIQLVIRFYGEPDQIHNNYDFAHAMCYYDYFRNDLVLPAEALELLLSRVLIYKGSLYPIASIFRVKKFIERGWRITAGQLLKIMWQISELDLRDPAVLREQLVGCDQAYMSQLIDALKSVDPEKINSAYIATIIDRIFE